MNLYQCPKCHIIIDEEERKDRLGKLCGNCRNAEVRNFVQVDYEEVYDEDEE